MVSSSCRELFHSVRTAQCDRPAGHEDFRLVADTFRGLGDKILLLLFVAISAIKGFDTHKEFYEIVGDGVGFEDGLRTLVQRDKATAQDMFAYRENRFYVRSVVELFGLWFLVSVGFVFWLSQWRCRWEGSAWGGAEGTEAWAATGLPASERLGIVKPALAAFELLSRCWKVRLEVVLCTEYSCWGSLLLYYSYMGVSIYSVRYYMYCNAREMVVVNATRVVGGGAWNGPRLTLV